MIVPAGDASNIESFVADGALRSYLPSIGVKIYVQNDRSENR